MLLVVCVPEAEAIAEEERKRSHSHLATPIWPNHICQYRQALIAACLSCKHFLVQHI